MLGFPANRKGPKMTHIIEGPRAPTLTELLGVALAISEENPFSVAVQLAEGLSAIWEIAGVPHCLCETENGPIHAIFRAYLKKWEIQK